MTVFFGYKRFWFGVAIPPAIAVVATLLYVFRSDAGNFVATFLAIILGIPTALWVEQRIRKEEGVKRGRKDREREGDILEGLYWELYFNLNTLYPRRQADQKQPPDQMYQDEYWNSLKGSGELALVSDRAHYGLASTYYVIGNVIRLERLACEQRFIATQPYTGSASDHVMTDVRGHDTRLRESLEHAIKQIRKRLRQLGRELPKVEQEASEEKETAPE